MSGILEVIAPGPLATVQDLGRPGYAHWGVPRSGAADRGAARLANRLVANPEEAACVEVTAGGLRVRAVGADLAISLTGAPTPATVGRGPVAFGVRLRLPVGEELHLGAPTRGLRTYLGVAGGVAVAAVLGSRSTDLLGRIGPAPLAAGDQLPVGEARAGYPDVDRAPAPEPPAGTVELRVRPGPRASWFTARGYDRFLATVWTAGPDSSRIGVRLVGPGLERAHERELASEGVVRGAVQVPPSGAPTLFLADHPVTGGYPVIATVVAADVDLAAQVRPGQPLRFRSVGSPQLGA